jgi:hypothetical protein
MKKIHIIAALLLVQSAFASSPKSSHPIYFNGGDVKPHQSVVFDLPYNQMSPGVLYDISCVITGDDITTHQPILNMKMIGEQLDNSDVYAPTTFINNLKISYPFQDRLIEKTNTIFFHNFSCSWCQPHADIRLSVYNFDDVESVNFSNCYIIVSNNNA